MGDLAVEQAQSEAAAAGQMHHQPPGMRSCGLLRRRHLSSCTTSCLTDTQLPPSASICLTNNTHRRNTHTHHPHSPRLIALIVIHVHHVMLNV